MMNSDKKLISFVIPAFNEEDMIEIFLDALIPIVSSLAIPAEIIFVDDGSRDKTAELIKKHGLMNPSIKLIRFNRNFGHQYALWAGMEKAKGDAIIMMDSDLQHPPGLIPSLINEWQDGALIVQTTRNDERLNLFKHISSKIFYKLFNILSEIKTNPSTPDFRLLDRQVVDQLLQLQENDIYLRGLIPWLGFEARYIPFTVQPRIAGETKYKFFRMAKLAASGITALSTFPLKVTTILGAFISLLSFYFGMEAIVTKLFTDEAVSGWASLMVGIFFLGGISMIFMGILGEYIGKIFLEVKKRPRYIIRETMNFNDKL